jgi:cyclophilin family peptidyl-prolyl cis-trans isomerase
MRSMTKKISLMLCLMGLLILDSGLSLAKGKDTLVVLKTDMGTIKLRLYEETPLHRRNFIKLVQQKFYDSLLFHRVIKDFMIQGGDPESKRAADNAQLGNGGPGYTIPAEIKPGLYHKKGVLSAARLGDEINPMKESSGSQFYIVQGKPFPEDQLKQFEGRINMKMQQSLMTDIILRPENESLKNRFIQAQQTQNRDSLNAISLEFQPIFEREWAGKTPFAYSQEQIQTYSTLGGTPHLDNGYTVFGEVIEGLEVIDKIAAVEKNQSDRPVKNVRMYMSLEIVNK